MRTKRKGVFICVEGIDGSGKTTQAHILVEALKKEGFEAVYTTEPSNGVFGKMLRKHILEGSRRVPVVVEAVLFAVDRFDHIESEVKPLLKRGKIVVSDRYVYSSIAYQGALSLSKKWLKEINNRAIKPDLSIFIDVPPEIVIGRINRQRSVMETLQTQKRVREAYLKLVEEDELLVIDGASSKKEVAERIQKVVFNFLSSD
ncbi:dTMP kinase [Candidatus Bathyarchaeota archaeon]|nr:dTMP kinase [Candidatus Bathyarchaeota archaeon]